MEFPAFIKLQYQPDGTAKSRFLAEVDNTLDAAEKRFSEFSNEAQRLVGVALSSGRTHSGALNLGVPQMQEAARAQQNQAVAAREVAQATALAAQEAGDYSQKTRLAVAATEAYAIEQESAAKAALSHAEAVAQVQAQLDRQISSTRQISGEFLRFAQAEAGAANGAKMLQGIYAGTAAELGRVTKSARESASAFELLFQAQAAVDEKAAQNFLNTSFGLDRVTKSARESASAFEAMFAAQERTTASAAQLRSELDPMYAAQQKFDAEMVRADELMQAGAITTREYAQAQQLARTNLLGAAQAIMQTGEAQIKASRAGTTAFGAVTNSVRASRFAYVMLGQQMQDVVIQAQMGTNAMQIFTQQVPQAAFALSGMGGKLGTVARFMSGVGGAAIFGFTALLGPLIYKLIEAGKASDDLKAADIDLSSALDRHTASQTELNKAIDAYNKKQVQATENSRLYTQQVITEAQAELADALAKRQNLAAQIASEGSGPSGIYEGAGQTSRITDMQQRAKDNDAEIVRLNDEINNRLLEMGDLTAKALDPLEAVRQKYADINAEIQNIVSHKNAGHSVEGVGMVGGTITNGRFTGQIPGVGSGTFDNVLLSDVRAAIGATQRTAEQAIRDAAKTGSVSAENNIGTMTALIKQLFPGAIVSDPAKHSKYTADGNISDHWSGPGHPPRALDFTIPGQTDLAHTASVEQTLKDAGVDIRRNAGGTEQFFGPGRGPHGANDHSHDTHFHVAWEGAAPDPEKVKEAFAKAQQVLDEYGAHAGETIQRINERFDEQPRLIDQAAQATRQLDDVITGLQEKKPPNFEALIASANEAKATIQDALVRPFELMARDAERRQQVDDLILQGHDADAQALQEIWRLEDHICKLNEAQRENVEGIVKAEYEHTKALQRAQEAQAAFLDATRSVRDEIERIIAGEGKLGDFKNIFKQLNAKYLTQKIFGGALEDLDKWVKENTGIKDSVDYLRDETHRAGEAALSFADTLNQAAQRVSTGQAGGSLSQQFDSALPPIGSGGAFGGVDVGALFKQFSDAADGTPATGAAANDNGEIVVIGRKLSSSVNGLTPDRYFEEMSKRIVAPITDALGFLGPKISGAIGGAMSGALYGYSTGGAPGGILGGIKGLVDSTGIAGGAGGGLSGALGKGIGGAGTGTMVAGLGKSLGIKMSTTGAQIGGAIGSMLPIPGGEIIGSIAGGLIGGMLKGAKSGRVLLSGSSYGVGGTNKKVQALASQAGDSFLQSIQGIASQLGGTVGNYGTITMGQRNGAWRVNVGGSGTGSLKTGSGAKDFGDDEAAAAAYALQQAIANGAVKGISRGAQQLLKAGSNLDEQIQKALDFQGVFDQLKAIKDPVGAALDALDKQFAHLKDVFAEAGATTQEYAQLEELYGLERAKAIKEATDQISGSLRDLYNDLTTGDMGLSLRDRKAAAQGTYDGLAARVKAGDTSAYDDYADAARSLLDIERQLSGSQSDYFALFNQVRDLTKATLDGQNAMIDAATSRDSPFGAAARGAGPANDNQGVIDGLAQLGNTIVDGLGSRLDAVNENLGALILANPGGTAAGGDILSLLKLPGKATGGSW